MCVILAVPDGAQDITPQEFDDAYRYNNDGFGMAWVEHDRVMYQKFTAQDEIYKYQHWRPPKPYVFHFRIATVGNGDNPYLCHPFEVTPESKLKLVGEADQVLFHNGHWSSWAEWLGITYSGVGKLPPGDYSDSRTMALMVAMYGEPVLNIADAVDGQRIALLKGNKDLVLLGHWDNSDPDKIQRSNIMHQYMNRGKTSVVVTTSRSEECIHCGIERSTNDCGVCATCVRKLEETAPAIARTACPVCFKTILKEYETICAECERDNMFPLCCAPRCGTRLYMTESLALKVCHQCRTKQERDSATMKTIFNRELRTYHELKTLADAMFKGKTIDVIPYSMGAWIEPSGKESSEDTKWYGEIMVAIQTGDKVELQQLKVRWEWTTYGPTWECYSATVVYVV